MSQDPHPRRPQAERHPADEGRWDAPRVHPLEDVLRLIARESPRPFFPREFLEHSRADPDRLSAILEHLSLEGLIEKVPARSIESGAGVALTMLGEDVVRDPALMARLVRGEPLREGDVGGVIRQGMRTRVRPVFTYALIAINVGIYVLGMIDPKLQERMYAAGATRAGAVEAGEWWRLITGTFLHGGLLHVGSNMFSLYMLGAFVEQVWGRWRFLIIYLVAGWAGSCLGVQYAFDPRGVALPLVGASGSICGLLGAVGVWFLLYRKHIPAGMAKRGLWSVAINVGMIALIGYLLPFVSNAGHLGGGIGGAAVALFLHVQRFGLPGMPRKAAALRWALGVLLLLATPVGSYLQMQRFFAGRHGARDAKEKGREDRRDDNAKPDEDRKEDDKKPAKKEGRGPGNGPWVRRVLLPASEAAESLLATCEKVPLNVDKARAEEEASKALRQRIAQHRRELKEARGKVEQEEPGDKRLNDGRKEAQKLLDACGELCDLVEDYLKGPTAEGKEKVKARFDRVNDQLNDFNDLRRELLN